MSEYIIKGETLSAMADEVRILAGKTESLSPNTMATDICDANDEISGQAFIISQIQMALEGKMSGSGGVELPELDNPADVSEVFFGAEYIDGSGDKKTGTFTIESELSQQDSLISQIQAALEGKAAGGSGDSGVTAVTKKEVNFYDYDGTLLYSYTVAQAQALEALPKLPSREGLICQGWNYDLATIKSYNKSMDIGATYTTDDGTIRIYIRLEEGRTSPVLGVCPNGTVTVDWGDGSDNTILTGTSVSTVVFTSAHDYPEPGDYVIRLTVDGTMGINGRDGALLNRTSDGSDTGQYVYLNAIQKIELSNSVRHFNYAFSNCCSLSSINIPNGVTSLGNYTFNKCYSLKFLVVPNSITNFASSLFSECFSLTSIVMPSNFTSFGASAFSSCYSLSSISIPNSVTSIGNSTFNKCYSLSSISIPNSVTSIGNSAFATCRSLSSVSIPNSVTNIVDYAFNGCSGVAYFDFTNHTAIPTLGGANVFNSISPDCEILVPASLYDEWVTATNWSTYTNYIKAA